MSNNRPTQKSMEGFLNIYEARYGKHDGGNLQSNMPSTINIDSHKKKDTIKYLLMKAKRYYNLLITISYRLEQ